MDPNPAPAPDPVPEPAPAAIPARIPDLPGAPGQAPPGKPRAQWADTIRGGLKRWTSGLLAAYLVIVVAALITLRAAIDSLDFVGVGWIILLAVLPLVPWLLPRLGPFLKSLAPYVQSFSLAGIQLELRAVEDAALVVPTSGVLAQIANDQHGFSTDTTIFTLASSLRDLRRAGSPPVGVIDLQGGQWWRLPNLYFLCFLLESDPILTELVFTEKRAGADKFFVLACSPADFRRRVDQTVPQYSAFASTLTLEPEGPIDLTYAGTLATKFQGFLGALRNTVPPGVPDDPVFGYLTAGRVTELVGAVQAPFVDDPGTTLSDTTLVKVLNSSQRYIPWTSGGQLVGIIDRDQVALAVARVALARA